MLNQAISDRIALEGFHITGLEAVTKTLDLKNYNNKDNEAFKLLKSFKNILLTEIDQCKYFRESLATDIMVLIKQTYSQSQDEYKKIDKFCSASYGELKKNLNNLKQAENRYQQTIIDHQCSDLKV